MRLRITNRPGYTLLEVMLASAIAVLIMAALYTAIEVQLNQMDAGRGRVESSALARQLFNRISNDLSPSLAPLVKPSSGGGAVAVTVGGTPGASAPATAGGAAPAAAGAATPQTGGATGAAPMSDAASTTGTAVTTFGIGVKGESDRVSIFLTRLGRDVISPPDDGAGNMPVASDVTRISYFLSSDRGLARQETRLVTSEDADNDPAEGESTQYLAPEVSEFEVRYFDGSSWQSSWDGSTPGPDGRTPQGPPRAIEITVTIREARTDRTTRHRHVIAFPAAPGAPEEETTEGGS